MFSNYSSYQLYCRERKYKFLFSRQTFLILFPFFSFSLRISQTLLRKRASLESIRKKPLSSLFSKKRTPFPLQCFHSVATSVNFSSRNQRVKGDKDSKRYKETCAVNRSERKKRFRVRDFTGQTLKNNLSL